MFEKCENTFKLRWNNVYSSLSTWNGGMDASSHRMFGTNTTTTPASSSLFDTSSSSTSSPSSSLDMDKQLRSDVKTMGTMLGKIILQHEGEEIFQKVEFLRSHAKAWREAGAGRNPALQAECEEAFGQMSNLASNLTSRELVVVSRAFTHFCAICNAAEYHHRSRRNDKTIRDSASSFPGTSGALATSIPDSCGNVIPSLLEKGLSPKEIWDTLTSQTVELVLTAHPTEVNRRTLLDKHKRMQNLLTEADAKRALGNPTPFEKKNLDDKLEREISLIWQSDEVSRSKPTPQSEAERGTLVVETVLWDAVPMYLSKLDTTMRETLGGDEFGLPLDAAPIQFSSWMGGDRDGNPNVTAHVTREVCLSNRIRAARLLTKDIKEIWGRLSTTYCSEELRAVVGHDAREPYRAFLKPILIKLEKTIEWAEQELQNLQPTTSTTTRNHIPLDSIYLTKSQLMSELLLVHRSLCETGNELTANGRVLNTIRSLSAFGLTLVPLDVRQESTRHTEALDCITRHLGLGSYEQWDESTRISWIQKELSSNRPLIRNKDWHTNPNVFTDTSIDTLETFAMIADQHPDSLGAYVISQATSASDVLAVLLLQRNAGVAQPLRVVPLFETLDDLNIAPTTMETLFDLPAYAGSISGKQEVMVGYSDSAKDAGRLAASWAQYTAQERLAQVAAKYNIDLTFFHGKGGTVGRGGNPATFNAILSHAPHTINGYFRVTEQGEMINQNFGHPDRAERTLDIYTAAICAEQHTERPVPTTQWRDLMDQLSEISCNAYRSIVREDPRFVPYFRSATPELELSNLNIGSRPAKRRATGGVESLRAIPWIFAWTQTRLNLPTWLGVGEAIQAMLNDPQKSQELRTMYNDWGSFRTTLQLVEMILAKSEPAIAKHYDDMLVKDDGGAKELGMEVRKMHAQTEQAVMDLAGHTTLCETNALLNRVLHVRNPYVDCMNVLQAEILKRLRECDEDAVEDEEKKLLKDALLISITGIANGMGNTG